ncbi:MAG: hypothetical protein NC543_08050 [bacterium]|nr:hypothetical protein [bacterium]MCM1373531.1 hypothetical protein [Muribaculum sp.]
MSIIPYENRKMKANRAMSDFSTYLKSHNIFFKTDIAEEEIPRITMVFKNCESCPGHITEGCIYFFDDEMEIRVYYSEDGSEICRNSNNMTDLYRLMNFLNARLWPRGMDGMGGVLYRSQCLFYPRFHVTEDGMKDITAKMIVPYTHYEMDKLETEDFITAALPDLLDSLSVPIFLLLLSKISVEEAISMIETRILGVLMS